MIRRFRRSGCGPGTLPETHTLAELSTALTALRNPQPWTPGTAQDIAVRVGPFIERAHTRPGDDHGPDMIAVALVPPYAGVRRRALGYTKHDWLRCETTSILGFWQPGYTMLTHAAANLPLPDDVGMEPAHYALYIEARKRDDSLDGSTLLRLGPYTQKRHAEQDYDRITAALDGRETTLLPGHRVSVRFGPLDVSDHQQFADPHEADAVLHLDAAMHSRRTANATKEI
ncbi:hypothetical protein [Streptomyces sp. NRRL S-1868]|uniref:hypothetical protein n=1 Tax=Streptomyces sp. NRRL S-1868 TaxID=1463892 RepID=UPI00069152BA|nr:hypothetical protein [Streptomyces sp. NRRL S-1868]